MDLRLQWTPWAGCPAVGLTSATRTVTEYWLPPDGGTMIGLARTVSGGKTVAHEFLLLRVADGRVEYVAKPSGQPETAFVATRVAENEVTFENPAHDFPTRITYKRSGDTMAATITGVTNGKPRTVEYKFQRDTCIR